MFRRGFFILVFASVSIMAFSQNQVRWLTFDEAIKKAEVEPRKIFIDVYTEWCSWCKKMDHNTLNNDKIAKYLNENYYPVRFDAEFKEEITFNGTTYKYIRTYKGGYHELATFLLGGRLSFPSIVFLDEYQDVIQAIPGYQDKLNMEMILHYFGENHYRTTMWRKFQKEYTREMSIPVNNRN